MIYLKDIAIGHDKILFSVDELKLRNGQIYTLIGANGKGKTTFLNTLTGQLKAIRGTVMVSDKPILEYDRLEKAKTISFVNSKFNGVDFLKTYDYIGLGRSPYTNALGRLKDQDHQLIKETIALLQIEPLENRYTTELSDGERQMAAIARAIVQQTSIIILDEPTAFLDYPNRKKVMELMKTIAIKLNKCIIVSSHDIDLCLESKSALLVIHDDLHQLQLHESNYSKSEVLKAAFNL